MKASELPRLGSVAWVNGPVVRATQVQQARMMEVVLVGEERLIGEIIRLKGEEAVIQVYEDTTGLKAGVPVYGTGRPLSVELGPGLVGTIYDGLQRPLAHLIEQSGPWIDRGGQCASLDRNRQWSFQPRASQGQSVAEGQMLGSVQETPLIEHRILVPPGIHGDLVWIAQEGAYRVEDSIARIHTATEEISLTMLSRWPVRQARPGRRRLRPTIPLITGQRIIDALFPLPKGGTAMIPGGFGTGNTIIPQYLAK